MMIPKPQLLIRYLPIDVLGRMFSNGTLLVVVALESARLEEFRLTECGDTTRDGAKEHEHNRADDSDVSGFEQRDISVSQA